RGRVWSGTKAAELNLVDELGGIQEAIADAKKRAGIADMREVSLISYSSGKTLSMSIGAGMAKTFLGPVPKWVASAAPPLDLNMPQLPDRYEPLMTWAMHDESVWLMEPWSLEIGPR
ncbi:MAG: hypothetical protein HN348_29945, partial [Proteobacteria bacterium]|nr:hypothetical protein [Pseudomonadota bacterium]